MAAITTYDLLNTRIDLGDALSWRRAQAPNFIRLFGAPVTTEVDGQGEPDSGRRDRDRTLVAGRR